MWSLLTGKEIPIHGGIPVAKLICAFLVILFISTNVDAVLIDGTDWRQLTETTGYSWNEIATVCPFGGGACLGSLGLTDFSGWTWATVSEVGDLFMFLTPHPGGVFNYQELESAWAAAIFNLFTPTFSDIGSTRLTGMSATKVPSRSNLAYVPEILDRPILFSGLPDEANTANVRGVDLKGNVDNPGVWLYRDAATPIPEPSTMLLFGTGLVVMILYVWRRERTQPS